MNIKHSRRVLVACVLAVCALISRPLHAAEVRVETEYGKEKVTPRAGTITVDDNTEQTFDAPEFVYLNRNFEELDAIGDVNDQDQSKVAYYRARGVGYAINGDLVQGAERFFKQTVGAEGITIVWKWELDYAVFIESVGTTGAPLPGNGVGNPLPVVGRHWVSRDTEFSASVDRTVGNDTLGLDISGFRYSAESYELENVRDENPDPVIGDSFYHKYVEAAGAGYYNVNAGVAYPASSGATLAWWGKVDRKLDSKRDQIFFLIHKSGLGYSADLPELGNEDRFLDSMTAGVRADGQFFVEEVTRSAENPTGIYRELASVPAALVGLDWHHWAVVFDFPETTVPVTSETQVIPVPFSFTDEEGDLLLRNRTSDQFLQSGSDYLIDPGASTVILLNTAGIGIGDELLISGKREIRVYRDSVLVFRKKLTVPNTIAGDAVQPEDPSYKPGIIEGAYDRFGLGPYASYYTDGNVFGREQFEGALNNLGIFNHALDPAAIVADANGNGNGSYVAFGGDRLLYLDFETIPVYAGNVAIPGVTRLAFPAEVREVLRTDKGPVDLGITGNRVVSETVTIDDWLRVRWRWAGQVRYRFDAAGGDAAEGNSAFLGQSFVRTYQFNNPLTPEDESLDLKPSTPTNPNPRFGIFPFNEVWIDVGTKVDVGAFYRTFDRCYTLGDFASAPSGNLGGVGTDVSNLVDDELNDDQGRSRVARFHQVAAATGPSEVHFFYQPTVFRAEIPLGQAFDAANPDLQLVPALCEGAILRTGDLGPAEGFTRVGDLADGTATGNPARWDQVGKRLLPVHPGSYRLQWPDANDPTQLYKIEIVTGYPGDEVGLSSAREEPSGMREGVRPTYVNTTVLAPAESKFPAAPAAHYRHHYGSALRNPPTKLDLSATDRWKFQELTFFDRTANAAVAVSGPGVPFTAQGSGRSVLLYSYRPIAGEIADGTLTEENLAVRVVDSSPVNPISPDSDLNPLGRRGLELGAGDPDVDGALGVISRDGDTHVVDPGPAFVLDFWLNTKQLLVDDEPVTVLSTGGGKLEVILDPATSTITAHYFGLSAERPVSMAGAGWSHFVIHVFGESFFGMPVTLLDFYADGVRSEDGIVTEMLDVFSPGHSAAFTAEVGLEANSLKLGAGANPESGLRIDQVRLFGVPGTYLDPAEVRNLRELRTTELRANSPMLYFGFETAPTNPGSGAYSFANGGTTEDIGVGPQFGADSSGIWEGLWARLDIQEVATRLDSPLDDGDFNGSGFILNQLSNYNSSLYQRDAEVGTWGPVFPVNEKRLYTEASKRLEVAYYENPFRRDSLSHPNVAWPYIEAAYDEVIYPTFGPHKDKAIYIASRIGSEGVDQYGRPQQVFDLADYSDLTIYNQPDTLQPGFNPNEEHALAAPSGRAALKIKDLGGDIANNPPLAAFALQADVNSTTPTYTSDPWVLVQVNNLVTGEPEMAAYQVFKTRVGSVVFPRPPDLSDFSNPESPVLGVNDIPGLAYDSASKPEDRFLTMDPAGTYNFSYQLAFPVFAGDLLIPPYPLNLVIGNVMMPDTRGGNMQIDGVSQVTYWTDVYHNAWVVSGNGRFFQQFFYPYRSDFHLPNTAIGTPVAWIPDQKFGTYAFKGTGTSLEPGKVIYSSFWRSDYPKLKRGETLTYQGGEYFNENPGSNGLPALVGMRAAEVVFDVATPSMRFLDDNIDSFSARIIRPLDRHEAPFTVAQMADAGFSPAAPSIFVVAERWYFKDLPGSLQRRFYFDSLAEKLVFRGYLNDKDSGDPDLTAGPDPLNVLEPNVITDSDLALMLPLGTGSDWADAVTLIQGKSQNPMRIRAETAGFPTLVGTYLAGMKESPVVTQRIGLNLELLGASANLADEFERLGNLANDYQTVLTDWEADMKYQRSPLFAGIPVFGDLLLNVVGPWIMVDGLVAFPQEDLDSIVDDFVAAGGEIGDLSKEISSLNIQISKVANQTESKYAPLDSFGVGSALVCNPKLLTAPANGSRYITIAENNRSELDGSPVSLHIIEIIPDRYRGAIKVIEAADAFSEKVSLQHNGEFGANTGDLYYEWWIRDAGPLDLVADEVLANGTLKETDSSGNSLWQQYIPEPAVPKTPAELAELGVTAEEAKHLGLHSIVFEGRPDVTLADKLVLMRYRHKDEAGWNLVPFEFANPSAEWQPGSPAPFQWAGAANSPQLQADGSKRYIPQLVMGWVKRVLDRINPYEARYTDFFGNESPATYSSQIQIAGGPFAGKVALNSDKNVIENTGLIELYETVLARARELSIDNSSNGVASDGIKQALLLAATRLSVLYELLAREAYSDAQDPTITVTDDSGLASVASFTHAFQNMEADLQHEELALLRGTDFLKSYPVYNRMFWNYAKGLGEAAYNVNYNIYDENTDGFINEDDARALYPQGHGDSWGHFLSALGMHYELLQNANFSWNARSELYSLMQNVLEVDFLDEKTFAKLAAGKARAGRDIVRDTYRLAYTQNPDGQWQGYTDGADPARAWGVSEWAHRSGQAAYFDWAVANALLPENAGDATPLENPENLDRLERSAAEAEIGEVAGGLYEIQVAMDEANRGVNPLGFDADALTFDIDPYFDGQGWERNTYFEQIYGRAVEAGGNAMATLDFAAKAENKLRAIANDTESLIVEALRQDLDYRNRLIEIFGRPYDGTIGFGKAYPEGYEGPDTLLFAYLDRTKIGEIVPQLDDANDSSTVNFNNVYVKETLGAMDNKVMRDLYSSVWGAGSNLVHLQDAFETLVGDNLYELEDEVADLSLPYNTASKYGFVAPQDWGQRTSYGKTQRALEEMLLNEIVLDQAIIDYIGFLQDWEVKTDRLLSELEIFAETESLRDEIDTIRIATNSTFLTIETAIAGYEIGSNIVKAVSKAVINGSPSSIGFSNDVGAVARAIAAAAEAAATEPLQIVKDIKDAAKAIAEFARDEAVADLERDITRAEKLAEIEGLVEALVNLSGSDQPKRDTIGMAVQNLEIKRQEYFTAQSEGFRLLREREAFNKVLAAKVQKNRYQDMIFRLSRNEAMSKYQSAFNNAARYAWLAARAYDYETSLEPGHPAAASTVLDQIVKERQLGLWSDGQPVAGQGGLAEILNRLEENFQVLKGQLGINNPQSEVEKISMRGELFRIGPPASDGGTAESDDRWEDALKARIVPDLNQVPEFVRYCRPFSTSAEGSQPGMIIRFSTHINNGVNFFGRPLVAGDHAYSTANYATKVRGFGVWLENYNAAGLATTPRAYMVPIGSDYFRTSTSDEPLTRMWSVQEQRIPTPFVINQGDLTTPGFIPSLNGVDGRFGQLRRHGDFRMYHDNGDPSADDSELVLDSRLVSRSVWNSEWMLIIPGASLYGDPDEGLARFTSGQLIAPGSPDRDGNGVTDIKLHFKTYSHQGE